MSDKSETEGTVLPVSFENTTADNNQPKTIIAETTPEPVPGMEMFTENLLPDIEDVMPASAANST